MLFKSNLKSSEQRWTEIVLNLPSFRPTFWEDPGAQIVMGRFRSLITFLFYYVELYQYYFLYALSPKVDLNFLSNVE